MLAVRDRSYSHSWWILRSKAASVGLPSSWRDHITLILFDPDLSRHWRGAIGFECPRNKSAVAFVCSYRGPTVLQVRRSLGGSRIWRCHLRSYLTAATRAHDVLELLSGTSTDISRLNFKSLAVPAHLLMPINQRTWWVGLQSEHSIFAWSALGAMNNDLKSCM